ncbi:MAG: 50S ribosomal protein L34e [Candidatus Altiarchaeota archaeon]|nr:50S ribosomal protein L34e [Candidatus Altiarchaeota archaeon]
MVKPMLRSRSKKKVQRRTPGGKTVTHYKKKKPGKQHCGRCAKILTGVPNTIPSKVRELSKSKRVPTRPYAGVLCAKCVEDLIRYTTRFEVKYGYPEFSEMELRRDLTIEKFLARGWFDSMSKK